MRKVFVLLLASLIVMLLCSGVASAGDCCWPGSEGGPCECVMAGNQFNCENGGGIWLGLGGCNPGTNEPCDDYCTEGGKCVPEMSTIVLLATGLICMAGYFRRASKKGENN